MELYGFMEREKKIPSYFFIITKNLPVKCVDDEGNVENYSWKLNSTGYPIQMKSEHVSYSFIW